MNDLINRQDAINTLKEYEVVESDNFTKTDLITMMTIGTIANCIEAIVDLPSTEPERKRGKWIPDKSGIVYWNCSECGFASEAFGADILYHFCPNCGARMEIRNNE